MSVMFSEREKMTQIIELKNVCQHTFIQDILCNIYLKITRKETIFASS
jgi:hypothetical protein